MYNHFITRETSFATRENEENGIRVTSFPKISRDTNGVRKQEAVTKVVMRRLVNADDSVGVFSVEKGCVYLVG